MLSTLRNAWKTPDLRKKILWTVFLVAIFRIGSHIPVPGIDTSKILKQVTEGSGSLIKFYDLIAGGSLSRFSIFAIGVGPYINASIIMQLLTVAIPKLEQLQKEGDDGRKKIQNITRYLSIPLSVVLAWAVYVTLHNANALTDLSVINIIVILGTLTVGAMFSMWLGDRITVRGLGNGVSLLILVNIVSRIPAMFNQVASLKKTESIDVVQAALLIVGVILVLFLVVYLSLAERRIPVQYAGKAVGAKTYKGQSTHIPFSLIGTAVIAIIFAMSVMEFPKVIAQFFADKSWAQAILTGKYSPFNESKWWYLVLYAFLTIFFTWFYTEITFKPDEMAENMNKSAGFIPGVRPGKQTEIYLEKVLGKISLFGGIFAALIAILPIILEQHTAFKNIGLSGTSMLILVSVSLEISRQLKSQLIMRHYDGFLN